MPETRRDFYDVLGVARDADAKAIKERFRELARTYHPDRNRSPEAEAKFIQSISVCDVCHGRGQLIEHPCPTCAGHGQQLATEEVKVRIPKGAPDGLVLRVAGHGMAPPVSGGAPGDLLVVVQTEPDQRFERRGADLFRVETLSIADAVLGTTLDVDTLDGRVKVSVPPGAEPDTVLRVHGKGLPVLGESARGDLYLVVRVAIPKRPSPEETQLFEALRKLEKRSH